MLEYETNVLRLCSGYRQVLYDCLDGYNLTDDEIEEGANSYFRYLYNFLELPIYEIVKAHSVLKCDLNSEFDHQLVQGIQSLVQSAETVYKTINQDAEDHKRSEEEIPFKSESNCSEEMNARKLYDEKLSQLVQKLQKLAISLNAPIPATLETVLNKYYYGYTFSCCTELTDLINIYLEVEEIFHSSDLNIPSLVLHRLKDEMKPEQLLYLCKSHQALKSKNKLLYTILQILSNHCYLISSYPQLETAIRKVSMFSKLEYTLVTDAARRLLLTKRGPEFAFFVQEVASKIMSLNNHEDSKVNSPITTTRSRLKDNERLQSDQAFLINETAIDSLYDNSIRFHDLLMPALNLSEFPTESLLLLACIDNDEIKKIAIEILFLRMDGMKARGNADLLIKFKNEEWYFYDPIMKTHNKQQQRKNTVIARWKQHSLLSYEWLKSNCDVLEEECTVCKLDKGQEAEPNRNENLHNYTRGGSKLIHMLNEFSRMPSDSHELIRRQHNIAFVLKNPVDIGKEFTESLAECVEIELLHNETNKSGEGVLLTCLLIDFESEKEHDLNQLVNCNADLLRKIDIKMISFLYLTLGDKQKTKQNSVYSSQFDLRLPLENPTLKYYYFRNILELPKCSACKNRNKLFAEETLLRNCEFPLFNLLELRRMRNFSVKKIQTNTGNLHLYKAWPKNRPNETPRFFVRLIVNVNKKLTSEESLYEIEKTFLTGLNELEIASRPLRCILSNHILISINYLCESVRQSSTALLPSDHTNMDKLTPQAAEQIVRDLFDKYARRIRQLNCNIIEARFKIRLIELNKLNKNIISTKSLYPYRIFLETNQTLRAKRYVEILNPSTGDRVFAALYSGDTLNTLYLKNASFQRPSNITNNNNMASVTEYYKREEYDGKNVDVPHPWSGALESKRALAAKIETSYCYDFVDLLELSVLNSWRRSPKFLFGADSSRDSNRPTTVLLPERLVEVVELVLNENDELVESNRAPGSNTIGMVAWKMLLRTPEFPKGRRIIVIINDITIQIGSFGVAEDKLFEKASMLSRQLGIPRIYIAVNSGARMGVSTELLNLFKVKWIDDNKPETGYQYLYLTEEDYIAINGDEKVKSTRTELSPGVYVYKIDAIYGKEESMGVENLMGSATIAGETVRCYKENVTITYVSGRSVGIGAYLARLGHRVIQKEFGAPIILTGFRALNKILGTECYTSNNELGGTEVMAKNGVTHKVVYSDLEGCEEILNWLSFIPEEKNGPLPVMIDTSDPISRPITYSSVSLTDDPRHMLTGFTDSFGNWAGGLLDKGTFCEVMSDYARSVIGGRGRIGGLPIGIICVETRPTEVVIPADPSLPTSSEQKLFRPGQVWFPESAYKTAQCIYDFNKEELPLLILANWRGFSGARYDMFHEILKFGAMIVDALVEYKQPCIVYIPPKCELRGGAWVVIDSRINPNFMQMYADENSRGNVIEPTGTVEIKFREKNMIEAAARSDAELQRLKKKIDELQKNENSADSIEIKKLQDSFNARFSVLKNVMRQIATHFCDLHDRPERMLRTKAIEEIVSWEKARQFFYWKFRAQLILHNLRIEAMKQDPRLTLQQAEQLMRSWVAESGTSVDDSQQFVNWTCMSVQELAKRMDQLRLSYIQSEIIKLAKEDVHAVCSGLKMLDKTTQNRILSFCHNNIAKTKQVNENVQCV